VIEDLKKITAKVQDALKGWIPGNISPQPLSGEELHGSQTKAPGKISNFKSFPNVNL
jgi:hypothetical protein